MQRLIRLLDATDTELAAHGRRASRLAGDIAATMSLDANLIGRLRVAAQLHDIGKLFIPDDILNEPGPLTDAQWVELRRHPRMGYELVRDRVPSEVARIVLTHHERVDGTGYPNAIAAAAIPLEARILQVADAVDAITSERRYQRALSFDYAIDEMIRCSGTQFDPSVVEAIVSLSSNQAWVDSRFSEASPLLSEVGV
ncbi:MAG: HD domain-containing protein [bacterium]|nr:HD domain-containing protein [bacterium]